MKIENDRVVMLFYSLKDSNGKELENNYDSTPMAYLHGHRNLLAALEKELVGMEANDTKQVHIKAGDAYGERRPNASKKIPVKHLVNKPKKLEPGQFVKVNSENGTLDGTVVKAGRFMVEVDFNHPLAGQNLCFDVKVADVREATDVELAHGHAHGLGGHHH